MSKWPKEWIEEAQRGYKDAFTDPNRVCCIAGRLD